MTNGAIRYGCPQSVMVARHDMALIRHQYHYYVKDKYRFVVGDLSPTINLT